jgi:hypothetical protein
MTENKYETMPPKNRTGGRINLLFDGTSIVEVSKKKAAGPAFFLLLFHY